MPEKKIYNFTVLIEKEEDGFYVATVPALKSGYTQAKTLAPDSGSYFALSGRTKT